MTESRYYAILLAAGKGSRFGGSKLTAVLDGTMLIHCALRNALAAPIEGLVVVTGDHADAVGAAVKAYAEIGPPIRLVHCGDHALGMSASLRCGLAALPPDAAGALIFLADMPRIPPMIAGKLVEAVDAGALAAVPKFHGREGHPVVVSRALFDRFSEAGDGGGRRILRDLGAQVAMILSDDDGVLADIDTPADISRCGIQVKTNGGRM